MDADTDLATMQWSGQRLLVEATVEGRLYQDDGLSMHRVVWRTIEAAEGNQATPSHIAFARDARQVKKVIQERAARQEEKRLKRAGGSVAAGRISRMGRRRPKAKASPH